MALPVYGGIGPPERTGLRLACSRPALRPAWPQIPGAWVVGDAQQDPGVVGQEAPALHRRNLLHLLEISC
jgi:hypothetical protein